MEDRIQINGFWYVKEDKQKEIESEDFEIHESEVLEIVEPHFSIKAQRTKNEHGKFDYLNIKFNRASNFKEEWDSLSFLKGVANREHESISELNDGKLSREEVEASIQLIDKMNELKWFE